jgi:LuxR family maltose regulon positive regulatory protein
MAAGAFQEAADLVAAVYARYGNDGKYATVLSWLEAFPDEVFRDDPRLRLVEGWILAVSGRPDDADAAVALDEPWLGVDHGPLPDGFQSLEASLTTLRAIFLEPARGDVGSQLELARRAAELVSPGTVWRSAVCWAVGWGLYFNGKFGEADRWFEESVVAGSAAQQWIAADSSLAYRSLIAGVLGRASDQHTLADEAASAVREHRLEDVDGEALLALGLSLAARGHVPESLAVIEHGVECIRRTGQRVRVAHALLHQAGILRALGQTESATAVVGEARSIINSCGDAGILGDRLRAFGLSPTARSLRRDGELTDRELTVLRLLAGPLSERDIARDLYLSHNTVHSHTRSIYRKLAVSSRTDAVARSRELGLL